MSDHDPRERWCPVNTMEQGKGSCMCGPLKLARSDEQEEAEHRLRMRVHEINDQVANVVAATLEQSLKGLRDKVEGLPMHEFQEWTTVSGDWGWRLREGLCRDDVLDLIAGARP